MAEHTFDGLEAVAAAWTAALRAIDPAVLDGAACERALDLIIKVGRTQAAVKARLVKRAEEAKRWKEQGNRNPDEWLARKNGTSTGKAKAERERAENLAGAPATEKALEDGEISPDQAEEIAAAANADPGSEQQLLDLAKKKESMTELRRRARRARAAALNDQERKAKIRRERSFTSWTNADGAFCFRGQGLPEDGARLLAALKPLQDAAFAAARTEGRRERPEAYAYDALMALLAQHTGAAGSHHGSPVADRPGPDIPGAVVGRSPGGTGGNSGNPAGHSGSSESAARRSENPGEGGDPPAGRGGAGDGQPPGGTEGGDGAGCTCRQRSRPTAKILLHVDLSAMNRGHTVAGETCEIAGIGPVAVSTARDLLGDAFLALVVSDGVDVRNITHLGRTPTAHQRTALEARGMRCEVPGCHRVQHLEIDHVDGWAVTRRTHVDQLAWLCAGRGGHHHQKTHDGFTLTGPPGNRTWHPPSQLPDGATRPPADAGTLDFA